MNPAWRAPQIVGASSLFVVLALAFSALIRGLDYATGGDLPKTDSLTVAEQTFPLSTWGSAFTVGGLLIFAGAAASYRCFRRTHPVSTWLAITGHGICVVAYAALAVSMFVRIWIAAESTGEVFNGVRTPTGFVVAASLHFMLANRSRWGMEVRRELK